MIAERLEHEQMARAAEIEAREAIIGILHRRLTDASRCMWKISQIIESNATTFFAAELWDGAHKTKAVVHSWSLELMQHQLSQLGLERTDRLPCDDRDVIEAWI